MTDALGGPHECHRCGVVCKTSHGLKQHFFYCQRTPGGVECFFPRWVVAWGTRLASICFAVCMWRVFAVVFSESLKPLDEYLPKVVFKCHREAWACSITAAYTDQVQRGLNVYWQSETDGWYSEWDDQNKKHVGYPIPEADNKAFAKWLARQPAGTDLPKPFTGKTPCATLQGADAPMLKACK